MKTILFFIGLLVVWGSYAQPVQQAEYFFNTDPGYGNGTPVSFTPGDVVELDFNASTDGLSPGIHTLYIRVKAARWSQLYSRLIAISPDFGISEAEYFFNEDPGYGNGVPISFTPGKVVELNFDADATALSPGIHTLYVRVKSGNNWSQMHAGIIGVSPDFGISEAEYFFNEDPGYGNGTPISFTPGKVVELNFDADATALSPGIHTLYVRVKSGNNWSQMHQRIIGVSPETGISQAEYFIGEDPGHGNGIPLDVTPGKIIELDHVIENTDFPNGMNYIYFRTFAGYWGLTYVHEFCQNPVPDFSTDFAELGNPTTFTNLSLQTDATTEYFWDVNGDGNWDYFGGDDFLHVYDAPGSYLAKLKLVSPGACADSIVHEVLVYACMVPTELTAENITHQSAELNWTPGNFGNQWDVLWGVQGFDPETEGTLVEGVNARPYFLTGLQEQTNYAFYVRTVCDGEVSEWSGPQMFTTLEYICEPEWEVSPYFQYNMQVIGKLFIDGVQSFDPNDKIGAFVNGECRGIASPDPDLFGLFFLSVGSDQLSGEMVEFVIWSVDDCSECPTGVSMIFENQQQIGSPGNPYPFDCGQHELSLSFGEGYTWFSANIDPGSMTLNSLFESLSPCEEDRILGQNTFATWYNNQWMGSLTAINPSWMYKMELCSQQSMNIEGQPVANNPITLGAGYTWLGYLPQGGLTINDALANITPPPVEDNRLLGQNTFAVFYQGQWIGSLAQLHPGQGYITQLSNQSILQYPNAGAKNELLPEEKIISPTGEQPLANKQYSMMLIAQLELPDGSISLNKEDVIYAYSGNECRGMAIPHGEHSGAIFMSVGSDLPEGEEITFKAWLADFGTLEAVNEIINFEALKKAGTMEQPVLLTLKGFTGTAESIAGGIVIGEPYPNPFTESTEISYKLNVPAQVKLSIYNSHGQQLQTITDAAMPAGTHKAAIHREGLQPGVYFYRMEVFMDGETVQKNGKIIIR
jgi:PKD repeat protein